MPRRFPYDIPGVSVYRRGDRSARAAWLADCTIPGQGRVKGQRLSPDTQIAFRMASDLAKLVAEADANPRAAKRVAAERKPIFAERKDLLDQSPDKPKEKSHLADYRRFLVASGDTEKHAGEVIFKCRRLCVASGARFISQLSPSGITEAIAGLTDLRRSGRRSIIRKTFGQKLGAKVVSASMQTRNHYLRAIKQFTAWLAGTEHRTSEDVLKHLEGLNVKLDRRHDHQDLGMEKMSRLLAVTRTGPAHLGMEPEDRAMLYETAVESGLRANELRTLTPRRCELAGADPFLRVMAAYSKHRREDEQLIRRAFAARLAKYIEGKPLDEPVWDIPEKTSDMIYFDMARAGIALIDEGGRFADFHALRHTYVCRLVRSGLMPKECQALARHASIQQTMDYYAHLQIHDTAGAIGRMEPIPEQTKEQQKLRATGTDFVPPDQRQRKRQYKNVAGCRPVTLGVAENSADETGENCATSRKASDLSKVGESHLAGVEPATFGSVDRSGVSQVPLQSDLNGAENQTTAKTTVPDRPELRAAIEKINDLLAAGRFRPDDVAGVLALAGPASPIQIDDTPTHPKDAR
jgi:integrase